MTTRGEHACATAAPRPPRTVLVTGGAHGLGAAMVRRLCAAGHRVVLADTDQTAGARLAEATGCLFIRTDVSRYADNRAAVARAVARFGGLHAVCLNAGVPGDTTLGEDFDPARYRAGMRVNLDGVVYGVNAALPRLRAAGGGAILITSSLAGVAPALDAYYGAAKHALVGLARSLAPRLRGDGVTVNVLCPGFIDTRLVTGIRGDLTAHEIAIADADQVAGTAVAVLDSPGTGQAWEVQAGQPPRPVPFPEIALSHTAGSRS